MNIVRKTNDLPATVNAPSYWDPFRAMREMMRWDPFAAMAMSNGDASALAFNPDFEVKETREGYQFRADLPGMKEKDLEVSISGNQLTISGHRESEKREDNDRYFLHERSYGSFSRSFTLPDGTDTAKIHADLKDGVLTLLAPRRPEIQPRKIAVKAGA